MKRKGPTSGGEALEFALFLAVLSSPLVIFSFLEAGATVPQAVLFGGIVSVIFGLTMLPALLVILIEAAVVVVWVLINLWKLLG